MSSRTIATLCISFLVVYHDFMWPCNQRWSVWSSTALTREGPGVFFEKYFPLLTIVIYLTWSIIRIHVCLITAWTREVPMKLTELCGCMCVSGSHCVCGCFCVVYVCVHTSNSWGCCLWFLKDCMDFSGRLQPARPNFNTGPLTHRDETTQEWSGDQSSMATPPEFPYYHMARRRDNRQWQDWMYSIMTIISDMMAWLHHTTQNISYIKISDRYIQTTTLRI